LSRLALPVGLERWWVAAAGIVWVGVVVGMDFGWPLALTALGLALLLRRWPAPAWSFGLLAVAILVGWTGAERASAAVAPPDLEGEVTLQVDVLTDARSGAFDSWILARPVAVERDGTARPWRGPIGLVASADGSDWSRGDRVRIRGRFVGRSGRAAGDPYAWRMRPDEVLQIESESGWLVQAADMVRGRIGDSLSGQDDRSAAALVSGFLIGDVRELAKVDSEAMRAAGLSHFVAVSGSNVALFLLVWWVLLAPMVRGPGRRAIGGIVGLALFGLITRWEPSVIRAATMAGLVLVGRAAGVPVTIWTALGSAVSLVLVAAPELALDVGFQLSVAATAGVLAGSRALVGIGPRWLALPLGVTLAAQLAVAPILLATFGKVPVWSPIANLLAAPLVTAATALGGLGALGIEPATQVAVRIAAFVLKIAQAVADLPSVGWVGFIVGLGLIWVAVRFRRLRPILALGGILVVATGLVPRQPIEGPAIVFLDVGQGDAILLVGEDGGTVLIDGGPDPLVIAAALARQGIRRIDLAIVTHADADHLVGILEVVRRMPVGLLWRPNPTGGDPRLDDLNDVASRGGLPIEIPQVGDIVSVGGVRISVIGPLRRYASSNDEGIVVVAEVGGLTALLAGDTEASAQREFGMPSVDILKVPHHGSRTTDLGWLASTDASVAVISVGENDFGHPTPEVLAVLESLPLEIRRTDLEGDIILNG